MSGSKAKSAKSESTRRSTIRVQKVSVREADPQDEEDERAPTQEDLRGAYVIGEQRGVEGYVVVAYGRRKLVPPERVTFVRGHPTREPGSFDSIDAALRAAVKDMDERKLYSNVYYVNERGNVDLLGLNGKVVRSWV